ncbi:MAG: methionyl-tRNA formyltransferase [Candidatus Borkfalkiaceae bacterium]|nr:methionyl-tRNA formyltransferase [Christensenellaceae bacterium]
MNVIFMGTPDFAVPVLESIIKSDKHKVVAVVTQPDRPVGRKAVITPPPVKVAAAAHGLSTFQFEKIRLEGAETLKSLNADIMVTCAYGQLLSQEIIDICKFGIINVHASLLPKYRGAAPIQYAVINGESKTGVTFMKTAAGLDTGDIIAEYEIPIGTDETAGELAARLSALGAEHICDILTAIENGSATFTPQNERLAFTVKTIKKEQAETDFSLPAVKVKQFILGMNPSPVAYAFCKGKKIKIYRAKALNEEFAGKCGEVVKADKKLIVKCGSGAIEITEIQEEGGKKLSARDFTAGRKLAVGDVLGKNV